MSVEVTYFVALPPKPEPGSCRINEFGWSGSLALSDDRMLQYQEAVTIRDNFSLRTAAKYLEAQGWSINWAWVGVHGE